MKKAAPLYKVLSDETKNAKENCLMYNSIIDFMEIERAYYKPKNGGKSVYLLDKYVGLAPHDKVSLAVKTKFVEEAVESSYQKVGENKIDLIV